MLLLATACAAAPPAARVVPSAVDTDDGALEVTVRLPGTVRRGTTVEVSILVEGRAGIATYDESAIDFSINGRGLWNPRVTPVGGEVTTISFQGMGGTILARGRRFTAGSRLGFTARFDVAPDAAMHELHFQVHASIYGGGASKSFIQNYVASVCPEGRPRCTLVSMKPTVLLIHSGGFTSRQWRKLAEGLASRYRVLVPDLLGYGESGPWPDGEPFHFRQDLAFLESLVGDGGEPVHLVGHSYGGFLALQLALQRPELVRSIAVYEPVAFGILDEVDDADVRSALDLVKRQWVPDARGADEAWLRAFVDWWNGAGAWDRLAEETRAGFRAVGWKLFQEVITLVADGTDRATYATIAVPTLLLGGESSPLTERRVIERLGAALPRATVRFFPGLGHMGPISHSALINEAIAAHLQG